MKKISVVILFLLILLSICALGWGQSILLQNVVLDSDSQFLSISVSLEFVNLHQLESILKQSGYPVIMEGKIEIKKERPLFWDKTMMQREIKYSVVYNPLTDKFVLRDLFTKKIVVCGSFEDIIEKMRFLRLKVRLWNSSRKGGGDRYLLDLTFVLKKKVPWWMEKLLFFKSFNISPPQSYSITFRY